jgi:hypothetical protein
VEEWCVRIVLTSLSASLLIIFAVSRVSFRLGRVGAGLSSSWMYVCVCVCVRVCVRGGVGRERRPLSHHINVHRIATAVEVKA